MASAELTYICTLLNIEEDPHSLTQWESHVPVTLIWLCRPHISGKLHGALRNSKPIWSLWISIVQHVTRRRVASLPSHTNPSSLPANLQTLFNSSHTLFMFHSLQPTLCCPRSSPVTFCDELSNYLAVCACCLQTYSCLSCKLPHLQIPIQMNYIILLPCSLSQSKAETPPPPPNKVKGGGAFQSLRRKI